MMTKDDRIKIAEHLIDEIALCMDENDTDKKYFLAMYSQFKDGKIPTDALINALQRIYERVTQ